MQALGVRARAEVGRADLSFFEFLGPVFAFVMVFAVIYAILLNTKMLGENKWALVFVSFVVASVFASFAGLVDYVLVLVATLGVVVIALFVVLLMVGFVGKDLDSVKRKAGVVAVVVFGFVFLITGISAVGADVVPYLPGPLFGVFIHSEPSFSALTFFSWLYSPRIAGAIGVFVVAGIASWIFMRDGKKKD